MRAPASLATISLLVTTALGLGCGREVDELPPINQAPVAVAGDDLEVIIGDRVELDGTASRDPEGAALFYSWSLSTPELSTAVLDDPTSPTPSFVADAPGRFELVLSVSDGILSSPPDRMRVDALLVNERPIARIDLPTPIVSTGTLVEVDGSASSDADGDPIFFRWAISSRPAESEVAIDDPEAPRITFVPDLPGNYFVRLIVNDGREDSIPARVLVQSFGNLPEARGARR